MKVFGQLERAQLDNVASDYAATITGILFFNTTAGKMRYADGASIREVVNLDEAQTLTNKTFTAPTISGGGSITGAAISAGTISDTDINLGTASNSQKLVVSKNTRANLEALTREEGSLYYSTDEDKYLGDDGLNLIDLGSGSGQGINYIDGNFDNNVDNVVTYKDAVSELPEDGSGGTSTITVAKDASSPLRGKGTLQISKPASNTQGEGVSILSDVVDDADKGRVMMGSFDYDFSDANYVDGMFRVFIYDITNAALIRVNGEDIKGGKGKHYFRFQAPIDSSGFRLILHCATTDASAMVLKVDNIVVGPQVIAYGTIVTDWEDYTPTIAGFGTVTGLTAKYRRVGDSIEVWVKATSGTVEASEAQIGLPSGLTLHNEYSLTMVEGSFNKAAANVQIHSILATGGDSFVNIGRRDAGIADTFVPKNGNSLTASTTEFACTFTAKIEGWQSQGQISQDFGGAEIRVKASGNNGASIGVNGLVNFTEDTDTSNSFDGETFTAPKTSLYVLDGCVRLSAPDSGNYYAYIDGVQNRLLNTENSASFSTKKIMGVFYLQKGQTLDVRSTNAVTLQNAGTLHYLDIFEVTNSQTLLEAEFVGANYETNSGQSILTSITDLVYEDLLFDSHNAYNTSTGEYTIKYTGKYKIDASYRGVASTAYTIYLDINGVNEVIVTDPTSSTRSIALSITKSLQKDDVVKIKAAPNTNTTLNTGAVYNQFSIVKVK